MIPEQHLAKVITIYNCALKDLESGHDSNRHLPKIDAVLLDLEQLILDVQTAGGRTKGYTAIKNELLNLQERIKQVLVEV